MFLFFVCLFYFFFCLFIPSYQPPTGTDAEKVVVREMPNPSDPMKNILISISDLHLDSEWSKNVYDRLHGFITKLASVAEVCIY